MFTGIVQEIGSVTQVEPRAGAEGARDLRLEITYAAITADRLNLGDSICVDGVCLTVVERGPRTFVADVSAETLDVTIVYDPATDAWTRRASMPSPRTGISASKVFLNGQPRIEVVGGVAPGSNLQYVP